MEEELRHLTKTINGIVASGSDRLPSISNETKNALKTENKNRVYRTVRITETVKPGIGIAAGHSQASAVKAAPVHVDHVQQMEERLVDAGLDADVIKLLLHPEIRATDIPGSFES